MSGLSWWRSWHGAPTDHKWAVIAARSGVKVGIVSAVAWAMLDYASQHKDRGSVEGFDPEEYAVYSGFEEAQIIAIIQAMIDKGIIINGRFANWEKRQPKREDDSAERVRNFRAKKRIVTQCNAPERDTDTEKDKEREEEPLYPLSPEIEAYREVTGLVPDIVKEPEVIRNIQEIRNRLKQPPRDVLLEAMREKYELWCEMRSSDGRPYNPSNPAWLEWCITGYVPQIGNNNRSNRLLPDGV